MQEALLIGRFSFSLRKVGWLFHEGFFVKEVHQVAAIFLVSSKVTKVSMAAQLRLFLPIPKRIFQDCLEYSLP